MVFYSDSLEFPTYCLFIDNLDPIFKKYILFIWLHQVLVAAREIFDLHCGMQVL